jgi:hypothetical protein
MPHPTAAARIRRALASIDARPRIGRHSLSSRRTNVTGQNL